MLISSRVLIIRYDNTYNAIAVNANAMRNMLLLLLLFIRRRCSSSDNAITGNARF